MLTNWLIVLCSEGSLQGKAYFDSCVFAISLRKYIHIMTMLLKQQLSKHIPDVTRFDTTFLQTNSFKTTETLQNN